MMWYEFRFWFLEVLWRSNLERVRLVNECRQIEAGH
jgi:hypothetical protein